MNFACWRSAQFRSSSYIVSMTFIVVFFRLPAFTAPHHLLPRLYKLVSHVLCRWAKLDTDLFFGQVRDVHYNKYYGQSKRYNWHLANVSITTVIILLCTEDDNSCYQNICKMSVVSFALAVVFIIMHQNVSYFCWTTAAIFFSWEFVHLCIKNMNRI